MRTGGIFFGGLAGFFAVTAIVYWFLSHEPAGTTALALTGGLSVLIGFYLLFTDRRIDRLPEDNEEADIHEGSGEIGFFSPHSWWPLAVAFSAAIFFLGIVFGWWLFTIGGVLLGISVIGFVFEYYRGTPI